MHDRLLVLQLKGLSCMAVKVKIPTPLRRLTGNQASVIAEGETVNSMIDSLDGEFPGIRERLCEESGELRHFVNIYVNGEDVRYLDGLDSKVTEGDEVSIVPAVAGGS